MRVLVTGANGQIGWELTRTGRNLGVEILPFDHTQLDVTDKEKVGKAISSANADIVINAAAYTAVDKAESEPDAALAVNRDGPSYLAAACANVRIPLIHISTDYVFDGTKDGAYLETDPVSPLGAYGRSKAAGEDVVRNRLNEHVILRTSWVYGLHGQNFLKTMLRLGREKGTLRVVNDQHGCPTWARDVAEAVLKIAAQVEKGDSPAWGTYHFCGNGVTTWYDFAKAIFDLAAKYTTFAVERIEPIVTEEYPTAVSRPKNSVLDCTSLTKTFGIPLKPWRESLTQVIDTLLSSSKNSGSIQAKE